MLLTGFFKKSKIITILLLVFFLHNAIAASAQETISLSVNDAPLDSIFRQIQQQSLYRFVYTSEQLEGTHAVSIAVKNVTINKVLEICFKDQPLTYSIEVQFIILRKKTSLAEIVVPLLPTELTGTITDENREALANATIMIKESSEVIVSDVNGEFIIPGINDKTILIISHVGYESKAIRPGKSRKIIVQLPMSVSKLDEVQVIAYGSTTRRLNTGDVGTINSETIAEQPVTNPLAAMEGRVAGLNIIQNTGVPGGGFTVQIRGQNSLRTAAIGQIEGNDPLFIIDGVPFNAASLTQIKGAAGYTSPLNTIDPLDIESIDVLKDADATSIYGSRGSNGVILITTKKGRSGKTKADLTIYSGMGKVTRTQKFLNTPEYLEMRHEAFKNDGALPDPSIDYDLLLWDTTRYTDWQKMLIGGIAKTTDLQGSVSGGDVNTQFLLGGGFHRESTVFPGNSADKKISTHLNLNHVSEDHKFRMSLSVSYVADNNYELTSDLTAESGLPPDAPPIMDPSGKLNWANGTFSNPFANLLQPDKATADNLIANSQISYELFPGLRLKTSLGYTKMQFNDDHLYPLVSLNPSYGYTSGFSYLTSNDIKTWIAEPQAEFAKKIGKGNLNILAGFTFQQNNGQSQFLYLNGFSDDALLANPAAASQVRFISSNFDQYKYAAFFSRIGYNWEEKYLVNLTARRDGSSRFGPGKQFANFGAGGIAWIFSKESFMKRILPTVSFGKLRFSYGTSGNDQIGDYQYLSAYSPTRYIYGGVTGLLPTNLFNPDYSWEISKKMEIGLETGFWKDHVLFSLSYYRNRSSDQLVGKPLPAITGFSTIESNFPATVQNSGWEFTLNTINVKGQKFSWKTTLTLTIPQNKLISFPGIANTSYADIYTVGQPLNIFKGFAFAGVDAQTGVDQFFDSKGKMTTSPNYPDDFIYTKKTGVNFYGGFENSFQFKNWKLNIFIQYVNQRQNNNLFNALPGTAFNQLAVVLSRWQKPGDVSGIERFNQDYSLYNSWANATFSSNQQFTNASFIRLKNFSLSYEFPEKLKTKMHLQNIRIFIQGQNLLTITSFLGLDPETLGSLPPIKMLTGGIQITL
jgi:TonB-dependent starch-binding outer membrane protein SusC